MSDLRYQFEGSTGAYAFGLSYGVNAKLIRDGEEIEGVEGTTIEVEPGDIVITDQKINTGLFTALDAPAKPKKSVSSKVKE